MSGKIGKFKPRTGSDPSFTFSVFICQKSESGLPGRGGAPELAPWVVELWALIVWGFFFLLCFSSNISTKMFVFFFFFFTFVI